MSIAEEDRKENAAKVDQIILATQRRICDIEREDDDGYTLLGRVEDMINHCCDRDDEMILVCAVPRDAQGYLARSKELAARHAFSDASERMTAAYRALEMLREALYAAESSLTSFRAVWEVEDETVEEPTCSMKS